jgi:hypothetical protein
VLVRPNLPPPQLPPEKLLDLLADPANAGLSNREIARRLGSNPHFVAGFRAALALRTCVHTPDPPTTHPEVCPTSTGFPDEGTTQSTPGHTVAGEPPALNSFDCWVRATPRERTKFVDAVGLHHLLAAAPPAHRQAFQATPALNKT